MEKVTWRSEVKKRTGYEKISWVIIGKAVSKVSWKSVSSLSWRKVRRKRVSNLSWKKVRGKMIALNEISNKNTVLMILIDIL